MKVKKLSKEILTVTPNPAIDQSLVVPNYTLGSIHRPQEIIDLAGGKGLNVARTIKRLQGKVRSFILLAGYSGQRIEHLLKEEGIPAKIVWGDGETRTCISIIDPQKNLITETYPPGQEITKEIWKTFAGIRQFPVGDRCNNQTKTRCAHPCRRSLRYRQAQDPGQYDRARSARPAPCGRDPLFLSFLMITGFDANAG